MIRRTPIVMHFTGDIAAGEAASELRAYGPIANPFRIRSIEIIPMSGVTAGQFIDVIISTDDDPSDVLAPTGFSIFPLIANFNNLPAADQQRAIQVPAVPFDLPLNFESPLTKQTIKARVFFAAPAIALPNLDLVIVIEELSVIEQPTESAFADVPPEASPTPSTPPDAGPAPVQDTMWLLSVGSPMNGYGQYGSEDSARAAAEAAATNSPLLQISAWGQQSGSSLFFQAGSMW